MSSSGTSKYGKYYYCVKVTEDLSEDGQIYVMADEVAINQGALTFRANQLDMPQNTLVIAPGKWLGYYAASIIDGSAVAVEHWKGEVERKAR